MVTPGGIHLMDATEREFLADQLLARRRSSRYLPPWPITSIVWGDVHVGSENNDLGDPHERQLTATDGIAAVQFPLGGFCGVPRWHLQIGDFKHENTEDVSRAHALYGHRGHVLDGNHDQDDVRDYILARHGSLTWGYSLGGIWFQAMTENYLGVSDNHPPDPAQIAAVQAALMARPINEPKVIMVHRALSGSYPKEWIGSDQTYTFGSPQAGTNDPDGTPTDSLTPFLEMLAAVPNIILVMHGHDHYAQNYLGSAINWPEAAAIAGMRFISPGSITQFPGTGGPYTVIYPEAFLVLRIWPDRLEYGCYQFGFSQTPDTYPPGRVYEPGVWRFSGSVAR